MKTCADPIGSSVWAPVPTLSPSDVRQVRVGVVLGLGHEEAADGAVAEVLVIGTDAIRKPEILAKFCSEKAALEEEFAAALLDDVISEYVPTADLALEPPRGLTWRVASGRMVGRIRDNG
ncbi:MAG: hypothetical protein GEU90_04695 [Gemmatimonas sp.]|nr:hypothetical protein [Gemmatimonas sp.]